MKAIAVLAGICIMLTVAGAVFEVVSSSSTTPVE